jgi:hypothetical protein
VKEAYLRFRFGARMLEVILKKMYNGQRTKFDVN